jgi:probable rRNA maturation factor
VPAPARLRRWATAALERRRCDITLRIVGNQESQLLNRQFRGKDQPTNVLSFPYETRPTLSRLRRTAPRSGGRGSAAVAGDIVLCAPVIAREAREQSKAAAAHWAHMVVHGVLHLRGFDHQRGADARRMEARERRLLAGFAHPDPYR